MKKLLLLFLFIGATMSAQEKGLERPCQITAMSDIELGQPVNFEFPALGQCSNCYDWDISAGSATINSSWHDQQRIVNVTPNSASFTLTVTYFDENGCHTCSKSFSVSEPDCDFEPDFRTKFDCNPQGEGTIFLENLDLSEVASVTYYFEPYNNQGPNNTQYYQNFHFNNSSGNGLGVQTNSAPFSVGCTYTPATCAPSDLITLNVTIEFVNGSDCETIAEVYDIQVLDGGGRAPEVTVFPNPVKSEMDVVLQDMKNKTVSLHLYDMQGVMLSEQKNIHIQSKAYSQKIMIPDTVEGFVFLKVIEDDKVIAVKKLIRE